MECTPQHDIYGCLRLSPLDRVQKKQVLDIVTKELLTPKGLRTLSPKSGGYNPNYVGPQIQRDYAYHQGTAWPWLMGFYMEAYLRIYKMSGISFVERQLIGLEDEMTSTVLVRCRNCSTEIHLLKGVEQYRLQ